ncbi:DUF2523 family protein [Ramlibacter humi]|uniref:DUF2523 domain-containing protein n=1 Tax=Ramlibacter humi TaxID=2530451 RepID=A0A4Z0BI51_9BURK|nr:DUF2523 domain-containing protein [Ramlibacter humi]
MPALFLLFLGYLVQAVGTIVGRVLISLLIGYVAYQGIDTLVGSSKAQLLSAISAQAPLAVALAGVLQVGTCINILCSAAVARLTVAGLTNGAITRMVTKG